MRRRGGKFADATVLEKVLARRDLKDTVPSDRRMSDVKAGPIDGWR